MTRPTHTQTEFAREALRDLAGSADCIRGLASLAIGEPNEHYLTAIELLAGRAGWLSECAALALGEQVALMGTDPIDWMVSPSLRVLIKAAREEDRALSATREATAGAINAAPQRHPKAPTHG